jgi:hypothetical protein
MALAITPAIMAKGIIPEIVLRDVGRGILAASLFLPTADPRGEATAKEGPYGPGETPRECSMIIT